MSRKKDAISQPERIKRHAREVCKWFFVPKDCALVLYWRYQGEIGGAKPTF